MIDHFELVEAAKKWLRGKCTVVITEMASAGGEIPDAIGWHTSWSIKIECKASRSDFLSDKNKCHRRFGNEMGSKRFYLVPKGLISVNELPEKWGLIEYNNKKARMKKDSGWFLEDRNTANEVAMLVSCIRRIGRGPLKNVLVSMYTYQTSFKATWGFSWRCPNDHKQNRYDGHPLPLSWDRGGGKG